MHAVRIMAVGDAHNICAKVVKKLLLPISRILQETLVVTNFFWETERVGFSVWLRPEHFSFESYSFFTLSPCGWICALGRKNRSMMYFISATLAPIDPSTIRSSIHPSYCCAFLLVCYVGEHGRPEPSRAEPSPLPHQTTWLKARRSLCRDRSIERYRPPQQQQL